MRLSEVGLALIKAFEECRLAAYRDSRGRWTIGWGHTGKGIGPNTRWNQLEADDTLAQDVKWAEEAVNHCVTVALTQNQFDALVAFVFNVGEPDFATSTLLRLVNKSDFAYAKLQFARWNKTTIDGKLEVIAGLTRRRAAEAELFATP